MGRNSAQSKKTTPSVLNSQVRKRRNRAMRDQAEVKEAAGLGLTVFQLQCKKQQETNKLVEQRNAEEKRLALENARKREAYNSERRSYWD